MHMLPHNATMRNVAPFLWHPSFRPVRFIGASDRCDANLALAGWTPLLKRTLFPSAPIWQ
jgi:hypothetical protein